MNDTMLDSVMCRCVLTPLKERKMNKNFRDNVLYYLQQTSFQERIVNGMRILIENEKQHTLTIFSLMELHMDDRGKGKVRVRITKKMYGKKWEGEFCVAVGKPNYREREYLKKCAKQNRDPVLYWKQSMTELKQANPKA
jgi:hypothetical protein